MTAPSEDRDVQRVGITCHGAFPDGYEAERGRYHVSTKEDGGWKCTQNMSVRRVGADGLRTGTVFFGGLEEEEQCTMPVWGAGMQRGSTGEEGGDMHVVAAGVGNRWYCAGVGEISSEGFRSVSPFISRSVAESNGEL